MPWPATLRFAGTCLAYLGIAAAAAWIGLDIWGERGFWIGGSLIDALSVVPPPHWLALPLAALPGTVVYYLGDMVEAHEAGISIRALHIRRRMGIPTKPQA